MKTDNTLSVIRQKIEDLPNVVMYSMNQHGFIFPSCSVNFISIDEDRQLWFLSQFSNKLLSECEQVFPARLHFYKKGFDAFVEVSGKAAIMSNTQSPELYVRKDVEAKKSVLIKMMISNIEYTESFVVPLKSKFRLWAEDAYKWIVRHFVLPKRHGSSLGGSH